MGISWASRAVTSSGIDLCFVADRFLTSWSIRMKGSGSDSGSGTGTGFGAVRETTLSLVPTAIFVPVTASGYAIGGGATQRLKVKRRQARNTAAKFFTGSPEVTFQLIFIRLSNCIRTSCPLEERKACQAGAGAVTRG